MNKTKEIWLGLGMIVVVLAAFGAGYYVGVGGDGGLRAELDQAKRLLAPTPYNLVSGQVQSINGNIITVELQGEFLSDYPKVREVVISESTTFQKRVNKSEAEMAADWRDFQAEVAQSSPGTALNSPPPVALAAAQFSDIQVGDYVFVDTTENVDKQVRVEATKVRIEPNEPLPESF